MRCALTFLLLVATTLWVLSCSRPAGDALPEVVDYNYHIKPILADRCYACHGPDKAARQAGLSLHHEAGAKEKELESGGLAIVPGSLGRSQVWRRITARDAQERMPPATSELSLTTHEVRLIGRWIDQGAAFKPHWAFITPEAPPLPGISDTVWSTNVIDRFVLARLEREGLAPSPPASRETLIRRVTLDLTGLPPTLQAVEHFVADTTAGAYERVVDRLLASPAYGEHMASEWMDVARYADTHGYQNDRARRMWPWRDWVINAFNSNMPFDVFGTWQLAGDLLPNAGREQQLATAFNRNHRQTNEGGSIEEEFRTEYVADRTNTVGTAFMGLTMECARCHDHKYDPISQQDYYSLFSFFNNIDESGQTSHFTQAVPVPALSVPDAVTEAEMESLSDAVATSEAAFDTIRLGASPAHSAWVTGNSALLPLPAATLAAEFDVLKDGHTPSERGPNGQAIFEPQVTEGRFGRALSFDGESGINFDGAGAFARSDPFTVSFWMRMHETDMTNVLVHRTQAALDAGSRGWELSLHEGHLLGQLAHMWPGNAMRIVAQTPVPVGQWVHVAMTYDGSSRARGLRLFVDGAPIAVDTARNNLHGTIRYENLKVALAVGYRFRDTGFKGGAIDQLRLFDEALPMLDVQRLAGREVQGGANARQEYYSARLSAPVRQAREELRTLRARRNALQDTAPRIMVMREMTPERPAYVLRRGQYDNKGAPVAAGTPDAILPWSTNLPRNRLGLAKWLFDPRHPLTARVAVNRFWQRYFGTGLVATAEDFGSQGALPTHPQLLDHLATTFVENGWDMKALQRSIVTSSIYRQSSGADSLILRRDPSNTLLARGPRLRLTAEMVRDQALAVSGLLDTAVGGPSVKPYQPEGLWEEKAGIRYDPGTGSDLYRRSLYTYFKRTSPPPSLITFDLPSRAHCVMRRQRTTTPMQALVLLNDPQYVEAARHLAQHALQASTPSVKEQITWAFRRVMSRTPTSDEIQVLAALYQEESTHFAKHHPEALALLGTGSSEWDQSLEPASLAAFTMLASALLSYDEAVVKY